MNSEAVIHLEDYRRRCGALPVRQACLPAGVDPVDQPVLDAIVRRRRRLQVGEYLFRSGERMGGLHVARTGAFKVSSTSQDGDETVLGFFLPGELIGLDALGSGRHRCDAIALEPAEACELGYEDVMQAATALPMLRRQLHRVVGQAIGRDIDHAGLLTRKLAVERVAGFLDDLVDRYCLLGMQGTAFRLPMSREDIARYLGLTLESVSRSLTRLQEEGVLHVRGRQLDVLDPRQLERIRAGA